MRLCHINGIYDTPNARKVHQSRIPRLGGVVFVPTMAIGFLGTLIFVSHDFNISETIKLGSIFLAMGVFMVYLVGILDDLFGLSANLKFIVQFFSSLAFPFVGLYIDNLYGLFGFTEINQWVGYCLTVFLVMFVTNSFNTIDGIDGLCSGLSLIALSVYCYFFYQIQNYCFCFFSSALIGSLLVFMRYNIFGKVENETKTFMGDSGSLMLGFVLSYLGIKLSASHPIVNPPAQGILIPWSVLFIPAIDLTRVAFGRMLKGIHPFHPDKTHIHHLLMFNGLSQLAALASILALDIILVMLNMILWDCGLQITWIVLSDILIYGIIVTILFRTMPVTATQQMKKICNEPEEKVVEAEVATPKYQYPDFTNSDIKVSIIVATYNSAKTLPDTLDSILRQTYQNYEVVLCDGASSDDTMEIVDRYRQRFGDKLIAVSEPDRGIYDAMNKGIDRATGEVVGILNSDDFYTSENVLERIVKTFKKVPLLESVYGDIHYVHPHNLKRPVRYYSSRWFRPRNMRMGFMPAHPSFYCLKELYMTYGKYNLEYKVAADFDQLFRLLFVHRIRSLYIPMDFVTMRTGGASNSGLKSHLQIVKDHARSISSYGYTVSYFLFSLRYVYKCFEVIFGRIRYMF